MTCRNDYVFGACLRFLSVGSFQPSEIRRSCGHFAGFPTAFLLLILKDPVLLSILLPLFGVLVAPSNGESRAIGDPPEAANLLVYAGISCLWALPIVRLLKFTGKSLLLLFEDHVQHLCKRHGKNLVDHSDNATGPWI
ncbi:hypothetical protein K7X08_024376 [Anisodus acutangulus]|uniref:Uncharacterized protein n=1 Tax=Anisodus acutangulus TaxID=402998 RepID=A0A9Q1M8P9_9SOLA|nr:hypothetical protein K7X08_024376 [Anisodus acutangulus]